MKKIACLSALACVLAVAAGSASAGEITVSAGYAQGDLQGVVNKANGFNVKYRYEWDNDQPLGVISSFTYVEKDRAESGSYDKAQYYGFTAGPAWRINDWASLYGVVGLGYGKSISNAQTQNGNDRSTSDVGVAYGAGLQFNPMENVALDVSYEQSRIRSTDVGTWIAGVGYRL
ncbi:outer membrane protein OmpX [Candidatus Sodalis endolongispinus]|uniref:Outer membrane protein X n=1 Tax=Candidatus Sodalis endolongispinus TaxID=2812662 RepID=A0ABS5YEB5_9GAMM|nr:outer membrane protein OmpX [Candidatus Sodalis endolongispinus]MBT9433366.1 outer membrane protein OmpX [Candidatus Sodalis endolongispinus]